MKYKTVGVFSGSGFPKFTDIAKGSFYQDNSTGKQYIFDGKRWIRAIEYLKLNKKKGNA